MKRILIIICFFGFTAAVSAQHESIDRVFDRYAGQEGFTTVYISKYMFSMFANLDEVEDEELEEVQEVFGKLNGIKILASEEGSPEGINFYDEIMKDLPRKEYEELMVVKDSESDVIFLAREDRGVIVELLLIVSGDDDNALIAITGEIDLNTIAKLGSAMNIDGMEELENLEDK